MMYNIVTSILFALKSIINAEVFSQFEIIQPTGCSSAYLSTVIT